VEVTQPPRCFRELWLETCNLQLATGEGAMRGLLTEFREFAVRGSVVDMAVGIIIGGAFGGVVTSLVNDVVMPPFGYLTGKIDVKDKTVTLSAPVKDGEKIVKPGIEVAYGKFINSILTFTLIALTVFLMLKGINRLRRQPEPDTRPCPFCVSSISKKATRCPHCTSELKPV
jgi:large conductance mechanosensitive channel